MIFCRGCRNRTHANGFGDHSTTTIRTPHLKEATFERRPFLLCFLVHDVLPAMTAKFIHLQAVLQKFFIFSAEVIDPLAFRALKLNQIFSFF